MFLVGLYVPRFDNERRLFPEAVFAQISAHLTERFGGVTAFSRSPAEGSWTDDSGVTARDDIIVFEVLCDDLDRAWWHHYKEELRAGFRQQKILIRAQHVEVL